VWWERIKALFGAGRDATPPGAPRPQSVEDLGDALLVRVVCDRCGEEIAARLRKSSDIQPNYDGGEFAYFVQKTLVGAKCFNRIDIRLELDGRYRLLRSNVRGGALRAPGAGA